MPKASPPVWQHSIVAWNRGPGGPDGQNPAPRSRDHSRETIGRELVSVSVGRQRVRRGDFARTPQHNAGTLHAYAC